MIHFTRFAAAGLALTAFLAPAPARADLCAEMFGAEICQYVPFAKKEALPSPRAGLPPLPVRKPIIVPIGEEDLEFMARPAFWESVSENFARRFSEVYDVEQIDVIYILKDIQMKMWGAVAGASYKNADLLPASEAVDRLTKIAMGDADPYDGAAIAADYASLVVNEMAKHYLTRGFKGTPLEPIADVAGDYAVKAASGTGTVVAMFLFALNDARVATRDQPIPETLMNYELMTAVAATCAPGSVPRTTPDLFVSPRKGFVRVYRGEVDCRFRADTPTCSDGACVSILYEVSDDGTFIERAPRLTYAQGLLDPPVPAIKPAPPVAAPAAAPAAVAPPRKETPVERMRREGQERMLKLCQKVVRRRPDATTMPAQCSAFFEPAGGRGITNKERHLKPEFAGAAAPPPAAPPAKTPGRNMDCPENWSGMLKSFGCNRGFR